MVTSTKWMLDTTQQVQADIAPGASGWSPPEDGVEAEILRSLIQAAETTINVPAAIAVQIRLWLIDRILAERAPNFRDLSLEDWEDTLTRGALNSNLNAVEISLEFQYEDEQAEEPDT